MNEDRYDSSSDEEDMGRGGTASSYNDLEVVTEEKHEVTYDSSEKTCFIVQKADSTNFVFMLSNKGLWAV